MPDLHQRSDGSRTERKSQPQAEARTAATCLRAQRLRRDLSGTEPASQASVASGGFFVACGLAGRQSTRSRPAGARHLSSHWVPNLGAEPSRVNCLVALAADSGRCPRDRVRHRFLCRDFHRAISPSTAGRTRVRGCRLAVIEEDAPRSYTSNRRASRLLIRLLALQDERFVPASAGLARSGALTGRLE